MVICSTEHAVHRAMYMYHCISFNESPSHVLYWILKKRSVSTPTHTNRIDMCIRGSAANIIIRAINHYKYMLLLLMSTFFHSCSDKHLSPIKSLYVLQTYHILWKCNSMEQSPSWEANSHLAGQEIPSLFIKVKGSLLCSQQPDTGPYPKPVKSTPHPPILCICDPFLILSFCLHLVSQVF